jgi:hypothetical protein
MRFSRRSELVLSVLLALGCSGNGGEAGGNLGSGGSGGAAGSAGMPSTSGGASAGSPGAAGSPASGGSSAAGAMNAAGTSGTVATLGGGGSAGGVGGAAGGSSGATQGGSGGSASSGPFSCTLVLGLFTTSQWFNGTDPGGADKTFLQDGVDATKWEGKMQKYSYAEKWANPQDGLWNLQTQNACAMNATTPDRALFVGFSPMTKTQADWEKLLNAVIANIKTKYPSVKEIDILTMGRAPNNMLCPNNNDADTVIAPYEDAAFEAVAAASNGMVVVGPKYYVPDCENSYIFANDTDYTTSASNYLAMEMATYYIAHP